jgi:hypothetical protein
VPVKMHFTPYRIHSDVEWMYLTAREFISCRVKYIFHPPGFISTSSGCIWRLGNSFHAGEINFTPARIYSDVEWMNFGSEGVHFVPGEIHFPLAPIHSGFDRMYLRRREFTSRLVSNSHRSSLYVPNGHCQALSLDFQIAVRR